MKPYENPMAQSLHADNQKIQPKKSNQKNDATSQKVIETT